MLKEQAKLNVLNVPKVPIPMLSASQILTVAETVNLSSSVLKQV